MHGQRPRGGLLSEMAFPVQISNISDIWFVISHTDFVVADEEAVEGRTNVSGEGLMMTSLEKL